MPLSPPLSSSGDLLQHGLHHLVQHNSSTSFPQDPLEGCHQSSHYGSPPAARDNGYAFRSQPSRFEYMAGSQDGLPYDANDQNYQSSEYQDRYSTPATSPPTPSMNSIDTLRTRSGLGIPRLEQQLRPLPEGRNRATAKPKKAKKEKGKADKKVAKLDQPLSILTKDWKDVPVVDIEAYVNRSAEVRRKEVEEGKIPGKVKRPMNSFMLYRKAYQNRTKDWCLQNNHQVVSQVCGDSWPLEPDQVKEQFSEWARIERINHQNAHPGYKFSPTKPGTLKSSKRKASEDLMSEESELDDYDWGGGSRRSKKSRSQSRMSVQRSQSVRYPSTRSAYEYTPSRESSLEPNNIAYNRSSYQVNNPGRVAPPQYQIQLPNGEYYRQSVASTHSIPGAQDVVLKKAFATSTPSYLGIPGGGVQEYDMLHTFAQYNQHHAPEHRIDPSLMGSQAPMYEGNNFGNPAQDTPYFNTGHGGNQNWHQPYTVESNERNDPPMPYLNAEPNLEGMPIHDSQVHVLRGHQEGWQVESLETGGEFDKWMAE